VANFCSKCGATLSADTSFCSVCGTPASAEAASAQATAPTTSSYQPPAYQTPAYQAPAGYGQPVVGSPSSSNGLKIVLIIVGVLVGLALLSILIFSLGVWRVSRAIRSSPNGITFSTPGGTIAAGNSVAVSEADLGVEPYPGAQRLPGGVQIKSPTATMVSALYSTSDPVSQVIDFYKSKLGSNVSVMQTSNGAMLTEGDSNKESVMVTVTGDSGGKTKIMVMHSKK
jgi:hypothetical protein